MVHFLQRLVKDFQQLFVLSQMFEVALNRFQAIVPEVYPEPSQRSGGAFYENVKTACSCKLFLEKGSIIDIQLGPKQALSKIYEVYLELS